MNQGPRRSTWSQPDTVRGFAGSPPNEVLLAWASGELAARRAGTLLDLGCGAARNAVPLAQGGLTVTGIDTAWPMLVAARERAAADQAGEQVRVCCAAMDALPFATASFDLVVAHGIWNLARSGREFREAVREAARVAKPGAGLFLFTFSRHTLAPAAQPVPGETFVFTDFSGDPQCFLTEAQVMEEMRAAGFEPDPPGPLTEYNRPRDGALVRSGPVIYEGTFRKSGIQDRNPEFRIQNEFSVKKQESRIEKTGGGCGSGASAKRPTGARMALTVLPWGSSPPASPCPHRGRSSSGSR